MNINRIVRTVVMLTISLVLVGESWGMTPLPVYAAGCDGANIIFSEIDYDQPSTDTFEFIELRIINATTISNCELRLLNGANPSAPTLYSTIDLAGSWPAGKYLLIGSTNIPGRDLTFPTNCAQDCVQNGTSDGLALVDTSGAGSLVWFISYEGQITNYNPGDGTLNSSTNLPVSDNGAATPNHSIINGPTSGVADATTTNVPTPGIANQDSSGNPTAVTFTSLQTGAGGLVLFPMAVLSLGGLATGWLWRRRRK